LPRPLFQVLMRPLLRRRGFIWKRVLLLRPTTMGTVGVSVNSCIDLLHAYRHLSVPLCELPLLASSSDSESAMMYS
jgi:hypothetical protein